MHSFSFERKYLHVGRAAAKHRITAQSYRSTGTLEPQIKRKARKVAAAKRRGQGKVRFPAADVKTMAAMATRITDNYHQLKISRRLVQFSDLETPPTKPSTSTIPNMSRVTSDTSSANEVVRRPAVAHTVRRRHLPRAGKRT
jgi:hypothetical protein